MDAMLIDDNAEDSMRSKFIDLVDRYSIHAHKDTDTYVFTEQELQNYSSALVAEWMCVTKMDKEIEHLKAKVAILMEAGHKLLNHVYYECSNDDGVQLMEDALTETDSDVQKFISGIKADCLTGMADALPCFDCQQILDKEVKQLRGEK